MREKPDRSVLDALDLKLLRALQAQGRVSNQDLADRVGLSPSACHRRVRRLERAGFIRGYVVLLDAFERAVARVPDVCECHLMAGTADYLLKVCARDSDDFERIHRQHLSRLPGVAQMHSSFALRTVVETTALPL